MSFDLSPCRLGSLTNLGHNAYESRHCPQCAGAFAVCAVCPSLGDLCPGCRHRAVLAAIAAGEVVFPALGGNANAQAGSECMTRGNTSMSVLPTFGSQGPDQAGAVGELMHVDHGTNQAGAVDADSTVVYNAGECSNHLDALSLGDAKVASPVYVLVLPLVSHDLGHVLQALAPVIASHATNGHREAANGSQPRLPRKTYLSDKQCPSGHTYQHTGKVLRFRGNNQCVACSGQRTPRAKAASQEG